MADFSSHVSINEIKISFQIIILIYEEKKKMIGNPMIKMLCMFMLQYMSVSSCHEDHQMKIQKIWKNAFAGTANAVAHLQFFLPHDNMSVI